MKYNPENIFAKIINKDLDSKKIYEDDHLMCFEDAYPVSSVHALIIPKGKYVSFQDFTSNATANEIAHFFSTIGKIANMLGVDKTGYRLITNHGADGCQTVFHFHVHLIAGKKLGALIEGGDNH